MSETSVVLLIVAGVLMLAGVFFLFYSNSSSKKKKKEGEYDDGYGLVFQEAYMREGDIRQALNSLLEYYENNKFMTKLVEKSIAYADGDYGDYETTLAILDVNDDEKVQKIHEEAIRLEIAKKMGLPENA